MTAVHAPDETDIEQAQEVPGRIMAAWGAHDADAFARVFTADGTMILPGVRLTGRDAIREFMVAAFAGPYRGTQVLGSPIALTSPAPGVVLLTTEGGVRAAGATELDESARVRATWLLVRGESGFELLSYQNTPAHR